MPRPPKAALLLALITLLAATLASAQAPAPPPAAKLTITGDVEKPLSLSLEDLKHLPRTTLKVNNPHEGGEEVYEGVLLSKLLEQAGVPHGTQLRGKAMATVVVAEGADGYRAVFALAELDSDFQDSEVIVADTRNAAPMAGQLGPLRIVAPHDKRPARWVRMLQSIKVSNAAN
jgi:hypothetical protein